MTTGSDPVDVAVGRLPGAHRLGVMLNHSTHLLFAALWLVAGVEALRPPRHRVEIVLAVIELLVYLAGVVMVRRGSRSARAAGAASRRGAWLWLGALVLVWAALCLCAEPWLWLSFPLFFLGFFLVPGRAAWGLLLAMTLWAVAAGPLRGDSLSMGSVIGPVLGAVVAGIAWTVLQQLRADLREQQRLTREVKLAQTRVVDAERARARADEREQLGRDLHDTLAQGLNSIVMLARAGAARHSEAQEEFDVIERTARSNLAHARALMHGLTDADADRRLDDELAEVISEQRARLAAMGSALQLDLVVEGAPVPLPDAVRHALVMATRSLVANVVQHSRADRGRVTLTWPLAGEPLVGDSLLVGPVSDMSASGAVRLDVVDDGRGFGAQTREGFGLTALRARMVELGGWVELDTAAGEGTSVAIGVPLTAMSNAAPVPSDKQPSGKEPSGKERSDNQDRSDKAGNDEDGV